MSKILQLIGKIKVPSPISGDAYTCSGGILASKQANQKSVYNLTNRYSPQRAWPEIAKDSRMVMYGLYDYVHNYLSTPITHADIDEAADFMSTAHSFGGPLAFDEKMWRRVVDEFGGHLPIIIEGLQEGSTFFPNEPYVQVTSLAEGFGEIAAMIEANMVGLVSCATARATITRHWLDRMREWVLRSMKSNETIYTADKALMEKVDGIARWMIHDFGMRASSTPEEAEIYGRAHLLSFHGTDTFSAAYQAWKMGAKRPTGTSILALAHRIVQGHSTEEEAYEAIFNAANGTIGSYVADCYDYKRAVKNFLIKLAKRGKGIVVARPDSGDWLENAMFAAFEAYENGLYKTDEYGWKGPTNFTSINGDSMTPFALNKIMSSREDAGFNPVSWGIFGVGGYLRNNVTRDSLSSAYKLSACGVENRPVVKLAAGRSKMSIPGPTVISRLIHPVTGPIKTRSVFLDSEPEIKDVSDYVTYYNAGKATIRDRFDIVQDRAINEFDSFRNFPPEWGCDGLNVLSAAVVKIREETRKAHNLDSAV